MAKTPKLEDFIKNYIKTRKITESDEGYESWLKKNAPDSTERLSTALLTADTVRRKSLAEYGSTAENLSSRGLTNSGYASFLSDMAEKRFKSSVAKEQTKFITEKAKSYAGYENYLKEAENARKKSYDSAIIKLRASGLMNFEDAYSEALKLGLTESDAKSAAEKSTGELIEKARLKVVSAIVNKRLTSAQAEKYASSLGLNSDAAKELSEIAYEINESVKNHKYSESYLDYLKEQAKKYDTTE